MPYITQLARLRLNSIISAFANLDGNTTAGELNFLITQLISQYLIAKGLNYDAINEVRGALENCTSEFYRRIAVPYEKTKIRDNGDVDGYADLLRLIDS
ncbi:hypothetical protein LCGC14_1075160 [marine sediment metagenome]|uniref:Uncharacterized protein n=1 Tax=marine sediment metagenome TaxID=412755 RepID=A0A0F9MGT5_9ZZZZ